MRPGTQWRGRNEQGAGLRDPEIGLEPSGGARMKHGLAQGTQRFCTASEEGEAMELSPPETACPARSLLGRGHSTSRNLARSQPGLRRSRASSTGSAGLPQDTRGCGQTTSLPAAVWEKEQCALRSPPCLVPHQGSSPPGQIGPPLHPTAECAPPSLSPAPGP